MHILIATGIFPPDIGGPAQYAKHLAKEFTKLGHSVDILVYKLEKKLPSGIRHFLYFLRVVSSLPKKDFIIALDSFSVGLPAVLAAKIFGKKNIVRIGGDFLWENYVEKTGNLITLGDFYEKRPRLSLKHKIIFSLSKFCLQNASSIVFSTEWQRDIFKDAYGLKPERLFIIENYYGEKIAGEFFQKKNFLWAGRPIKLKNINLLKEIFQELEKERPDIKLEIMAGAFYEELMEKIRNCYAVILPSISDISPNFILDAIRCNKPFILTKETGLYDKLKNIGLFTSPFNRKDIKDKILFLADQRNYDEYKRRVAEFNFTHSWREIAEDFLKIYKNL